MQPITTTHIKPRAIVNEFPIYFNLIELGFRHKTVNMSVEFVSDEGIQINMIGGFSGNSIHLFKLDEITEGTTITL